MNQFRALLVFPALLILLGVAFVPSRAGADPLLTRDPQCGTLVNTSKEVRIYGTLRTDYFADDNGQQRRHEVQFRLEPGEDQQVCSTGPFFPGYTVMLNLRTLMPVFECQTKLAGKIYLHADRQPNESWKLYADCVAGTESVRDKFFKVLPP